MNNASQIIGKQILRGHVLRIANDAEPLGAGVEVIQAVLKQHGYAVEKDELLEICNYLQGKELIKMEQVKNDVLKIRYDIAHITPRGVDVLEGTEQVGGIGLGD